MRYVLVAAMVALIAACGGSGTSEDAYIDGLRDVVNDTAGTAKTLQTLLEQVDERPALAANDQWLADFRAESSALHASLDRIRKLTPPDGLADVHTSYLRAVECLSDGTDQLLDGYTSNNGLAVASANTFMESCADLWTDANGAIQTAVPTD